MRDFTRECYYTNSKAFDTNVTYGLIFKMIQNRLPKIKLSTRKIDIFLTGDELFRKISALFAKSNPVESICAWKSKIFV